MSSSTLLQEVLNAHGGVTRWESVNLIQASFSAGGLAFASRMQPFALRNLRFSIQPHARKLVLHGYSGAGRYGVWTPTEVKTIDELGATRSLRTMPRSRFARFRSNFYWDHLDLLYFAGYALWNYVCFPFVLNCAGVSVLESQPSDTKNTRSLIATFDDDFPTHSRRQVFFINDRGLLTRHDYTADVIGSWATAAHFCEDSIVVDSIRIYTRRRVVPRLNGQFVIPFPTLVWIKIDDVDIS